MTKIRRGPVAADNFTMLPNSQVRDSGLSWGARGLLAWLHSHQEGFEVTEDALIEAGPSARDGIRSMIRELENLGYLRRERTPIVTGGSTVDYVLMDPRGTPKPSVGVDDPTDAQAAVRADQAKQDVRAGQPTDALAVPRSSVEDQKKTKTPSVSKRATATRIPDDFYPTPEMQEWFKREGLHEAIPSPRIEHEKFCDYWGAKGGPDARKIDWVKTWRNWMRSAAERNGRGGYRAAPGFGGTYRSTTDAKVAQTLDLAEKFRLMEENQ